MILKWTFNIYLTIHLLMFVLVVVWKYCDHGLVGWLMVKWRICQLFWIPGNKCFRTRLANGNYFCLVEGWLGGTFWEALKIREGPWRIRSIFIEHSAVQHKEEVCFSFSTFYEVKPKKVPLNMHYSLKNGSNMWKKSGFLLSSSFPPKQLVASMFPSATQV